MPAVGFTIAAMPYSDSRTALEEGRDGFLAR
jgi:hypothetical protein